MPVQGQLKEVLTTSTPRELVDVLELLSEGDVKNIIDHLDPGDLADLLQALDPAVISAVLDKLDLSEIANLLGRVDPASVPFLLDTADPRHLKVLTEHISTPGQLKRILDLSHGDDELVDRFLEKAGDDVILDRVFALMPTRLLYDQLGDDSGVVEWRVETGRGLRLYHLVVSASGPETGPGPAPAARTSVTISAANLLRLSCGVLDGISAFLVGKAQINGDILFGAKLAVAFDLSQS